ncbi:Molecular chaperone (DnaJ superfamily) [Handroanthus impetiginosus]|uniref:Molecular chaperone (DnaJ superfamily) n=1 Tax=Handroanthus impetiginosus TaxID=429701 RepID=A0A2G9HU63_9LAMI|nr:Molecular chaperone (DnaJ superfamily) [Handroanthus impetiginosus]
MEDIGLFKQGLKWMQSKDCYSVARSMASCLRDKIGVFMERHWPMVCCGCARCGRGLLLLLIYWKNCFVSGFHSFIGLGSTALLVIMWSCFLSLTSMSCVLYVLLSMGAAGAAVQYLGCTPGLFIVGLFAIIVLWMYANFWITGTLFIVGGYLFSLNHARLVVFMATLYAIYCAKVRAGWLGVLLSISLAFLSNDIFNYSMKWCDNWSENTHFEEHKEPESFIGDDFSTEHGYSAPLVEEENLHSCKSASKPASTSSFVEKPKESVAKQVVREDVNSITEMKRILGSNDHYEALGFPRERKIDLVQLKKEYHKKAMLVHPDKNMGSPLASDSFKRLQCAYEVLSDAVKKRDYDEQLRKEESKRVLQRSASTSHQNTTDFCSEESRSIQCTKCGNSHIWVCTNRTKAKARWCQDCCQYHQAKDGDGWVEYKGSLVFDRPQTVEIPRAFVCAESRIFDVSEWAICQGMACRPNTHRPSFHVNMVGLEKSTQRSNSSRYPWDLDAEMMDEEDEFELWLQQALASGLFCETSKRRKTWSPFKLPQKKVMKQWRRFS